MHSSLQLQPDCKIGKEQFRKIKIVHASLLDSNDSYDFRVPVDWKNMGLTDYPTMIKYPMDLSTVMRKLNDERYKFVEEFLDDIQLIWDNCKIYNPSNSWIYSIAEKLQRSFKKMVKNYFPDCNVVVPVKETDAGKKVSGPFDEENEDITYQQKLKFSEELSYLSSSNLERVINQIIAKCPIAYRDMPEGRGQILVDSMNLVFFHQICLQVKLMREDQIEEE